MINAQPELAKDLVALKRLSRNDATDTETGSWVRLVGPDAQGEGSE